MRLALAVAAAVAVTLLLAFGAMDAVELPVRDLVMRRTPAVAATSTAVVAIDEQSLRAIGPWPWPRETIAQLVETAKSAGARGVVLDVLLTDAREGDERLAEAMRGVPTVMVAVLDERGQWLMPAPVLRAAAKSAHGNFELDGDGILRRFATTKQSRDRALVALPFEAAMIYRVASVPIGRSIAPAFRTRPHSIPVISAADLLGVAPPTSAASPLRDRLVFLGPTALALGDRVLTPVTPRDRPDAGVTVHAAATESLVRHEIILAVPPIASGILGGLFVAAILFARSGRRALAASLVLLIAGGGMLLLTSTGIAIPFVTLLLCVLASIAGVEIARMSRELTQSTATVSRLSETKSVLAHELKTPLASMRGLTQLLGGYDLSDEERRRVTSLLESEAGKLQSMVGALLDLDRLPARNFDASTAVIDLGDLTAARVELLRGGTGREIDMSITPDVFVRADAALLERVIDNLVGNAIKYTPAAAPIRVSVRASDGEAVLDVEDQGPGIATEERKRVFDRFFRGTSAAETQGLGLGLSLVAEVARWHSGGVAVEDAQGGGARFRVTLPLASAAARSGAM